MTSGLIMTNHSHRLLVSIFFLVVWCIHAHLVSMARAEEPSTTTVAHASEILDILDFTPDGRTLVGRTCDGLLTIESDSGQPTSVLRGPTVESRDALSTDMACIMQQPSPESTIGVILSMETGKKVRSVTGCFSGKEILALHEPELRVFEGYTASCLGPGGGDFYVMGSFTSKSSLARISLTGSNANWSWRRELSEPTGPTSLIVSKDGKLLLTTAGRWAIYNAADGRQIAKRNVIQAACHPVFSGKGDRFSICSYRLGDKHPSQIEVVDSQSLKTLKRREYSSGLYEDFLSCSASQDLHVIVSVQNSLDEISEIRCWYPEDGSVKTFLLPWVRGVCVSPDGHRVVAFDAHRAWAYTLPECKKIWSYSEKDDITSRCRVITAETSKSGKK